jgi:hypothetical protein
MAHHLERVTTWQESLEIVISRTGHSAFRRLTSDDNPNVAQRDGYRRLMVEMATGKAPTPEGFPGLFTQAGNALGAIGRAAGQLLSGGQLRVDDSEFERRMTLCRACPEYDPVSVRCRKCSCFLNLKARLESETGQCPLKRW